VTTSGIVDEKRAGRSFWDANPCGGQWESYAAFADWIERTEPYAFDILAKHQWENVRVLEVGCGQGTVLNHLAARRADAVGVDMSMVSIERARAGARELRHRVEVAQSDAEALPFPDASFNAVVSFGVLHHTPDTAKAIREVRRVLKPGGLAIVMLYRTGNPKWWVTRSIRGASAAIDRLSGETARIAGRLRTGHGTDGDRGTALLELFGVPTMQAFSNRQSRRFFEGFTSVDIRNYQPGFRRLADMSPLLRPLAGVFTQLDRVTESIWGFYQVIEARR
jgi:ubiquinone/menaquinone biosynthesis C-methylase UbiE